MRIIDLSHVVAHGTITYPGLPAPEIGSHLSFEESHAHYDEGYEFSIGRISMIANTGTYLDTPAHRYRGGEDLAAVGLDRCAMLPALVVDARGPHAIAPTTLEGLDLDGKAVLFHTGWDAKWGTAAYGDADHPHLTEATAAALIAGGAVLAGIDSVNIDPTTTGARPIHSALLGAGILVVEHLTKLEQLPPSGASFTAAPVAIEGMATFPVRAFATIP